MKAGREVEPGSGSQVRDVNGGIPPNGLFWTVGLPGHAFQVSRHGRRASLHARAVPLIETFQFAGVFSTPVTIDVAVEWEVTGSFQDLGSGNAVPPDDPAAFLGRFAPARATGRISGTELGFRFRTRSATSDQGWAELGTERNGSFLA